MSCSKKLVFGIVFLAMTGAAVCAQTDDAGQGVTSLPVEVSLSPDLNEFYLYADGGWDGNWFVGYSNCWLVKLPPISKQQYKKAYIGAKLGRAKGFPVPNRPWEKQPMEGKLYMGISKDGAFNSQQSYFLVDNSDIPLEAQPKETLKGVGSSRWFWTEVPIGAVSSSRSNYLALWAEADAFTDVSKAPVVAGAPLKMTEASVWLNSSQKGTPPRDSRTAFELPVNGMAPAMAIKLVPENNLKVVPRALRVDSDDANIVISFSVIGQDVYRSWVEISYDRFNWQRYSKFLFNPPYSVTISKKSLPKGKFYFRAAAVDTLENVGYSNVLTVSGSY